MVNSKVFYTKKEDELAILNILKSLQYLYVKFNVKYNLIYTELISKLIKEFDYDGIVLIKYTLKSKYLINIDELIDACSIGSHVILNNFHKLIIPKKNKNHFNFYKNIILQNETYTLIKYNRLGDSLTFLNGLENYCISNKIEFINVTGLEVYDTIIKLFNINHIRYIKEFESPKNLDFVFSLSSWGLPWMKRFYESLSNITEKDIKYSENIKLKSNKIEANYNVTNTILCQFDSRSAIIDDNIISEIIAFFSSSSEIKVIGGLDTKKYLGNSFIYELGDLNFIVEKLNTSKYFIGCDSGIGHLAGLMGVKSYIFNFTDFEPVFHFFKEYKNTLLIPLNFIKLKNNG